ncbi:MAG TPA: LysR family transcriptional regulator [Bryobacteraceae bacterium]|nr:LysR family transcriptional regulator [Bryobacteraceae bacterium]
MRSVHLRNLDLNLLVPLRALLEERHVTAAAKRSFLSQPAMSRVLERLREMFEDPLLVRTGRTYERTIRADGILGELETILPRLEAMVRGGEFDPAQSDERFRVALTDNASTILLPSLVAHVREAAPHVKLEVTAWRTQAYEDVAAGRIHTALSAEGVPLALQSEIIFSLDFVCLVGSAQRMRTRRFTLKQYLQLPHALIETLAGQQTLVDRPLAQFGLQRSVVLSIPFFVPAIYAIAHSDLVLTVPRKLAKITAGLAGIRVVEPPHELKAFPYFMAWHSRLTDEPAHLWFREQIRRAVRMV